LAVAAAALGCRYDGTGTKMQWAPDMADGPIAKSQRVYIDPPEGAVPMSAIFYPKTAEDAGTQLVMPELIAKDPQGVEKGKQLFNTFCIPCHGPDAKGGHLHPAIAPPDLTQETYRTRGDGFFFYRITFGTSVMPGYGHAISAHERWQIVRYLRTLQKAGH
jgi:mono/diheme cytochrome c family protein